MLTSVHSVFHVFMLRKYIPDPSHVLDASTVQLDKNLTYGEEPMFRINKQIRKLRSKKMVTVKVCGKTILERRRPGKMNRLCKRSILFYVLRFVCV